MEKMKRCDQVERGGSPRMGAWLTFESQVWGRKQPVTSQRTSVLSWGKRTHKGPGGASPREQAGCTASDRRSKPGEVGRPRF